MEEMELRASLMFAAAHTALIFSKKNSKMKKKKEEWLNAPWKKLFK